MKVTRNNLYYLLGFGFMDFSVQDSNILLTKKMNSRQVLEDLAYMLNTKISINKGSVTLTVSDEEVVQFLNSHGATTPKRYMPKISDDYIWSFISGCFDGYGEFTFKGDNARITLNIPCTEILDFVSIHWNVKREFKHSIMANGYKALDVCGKMYSQTNVRHFSMYNNFFEILNHNPDKDFIKEHKFKYVKLAPNAIAPVKSRVTDSGFDLHIVSMTRLYTTPWGAQVYEGKTNLAIKPVLGYAFDLVGRSSLPKKGWHLLQGVGIIDRSYSGGVMGTFLKLDGNPLPEMPWKALQLVPRDAPLHVDWEEVKSLGESDREHKGFGSTDEK